MEEKNFKKDLVVIWAIIAMAAFLTAAIVIILGI